MSKNTNKSLFSSSDESSAEDCLQFKAKTEKPKKHSVKAGEKKSVSKHTPTRLSSSSEDESTEEAVHQKEKSERGKKRKADAPAKSTAMSGSHPSSSSAAAPRKKSKAEHSTRAAKSSARDVFGSASEDEALEATSSLSKKTPPIYSYITRRLANGFSRQINERKSGEFYIELKVYKTDEINNIQPVNRWRHSIITIKNKLDDDSESWRHLNEFIKVSRKEFNKTCTPTFIDSYQ